MNKTFYDHGIDTKGKISGQVKIPCPKCSHTRKKKYDPCLSVNIDDEVWNKVVKKLRKRQHKERNALRLKRKVSNNKIISRRKKHKQKNFAIASTHSI